ncbi:tripartite tricarboxylate transporter substrate binding protein [Noviherbaspirillum sp. CPCC 100848]|uniref:Tripartite tricarboxylate transporter substrate binding protein n=1 Tax=Noviherbaspirillum album TaxID=3080276 RepID=A0ABU6JD89_9BURK|nr:tripartite tricarboxylate transporter substrate binding protein [Noviherbaspirillum sp. CPCC 100848]MEC4721606.1 tripartite tricarboxylate transporter substrate binding protein [Noviherbaspirillum sp. CPCC 100848]
MKPLQVVAAAALGCFIAVQTQAQTQVQAQAQAAAYPVRTVTLVVPFAPGGGTDTGTRILAQQLSQKWRQPVVVENKPGAAGMIGADTVARATPDGYTLLIGNLGTQSVNPSLYKKMPYNADKAFTAVSLIAELPLLLVVNQNSPAKSLSELVALAKTKQGGLSYSSSGSGGSMHLAAELLASGTATKMLHVPYKGGGPAIQDLLAGQVDMSIATILELNSHIKSGKLRPLAQMGTTRAAALPNIPTAAEAGVPGFNATSWMGLLAPAGTPKELIERISADVQEAVNTPEIRDKFASLGAVPVGSDAAGFQRLIDADRSKYAKLIKEKGIVVD